MDRSCFDASIKESGLIYQMIKKIKCKLISIKGNDNTQGSMLERKSPLLYVVDRVDC